jgi:DNA-binding transcriptional MerR regulator
MTQFEIIMRTDTPELPAEIGNFDEVKAAISEALTQYRTDVVITESSVKDAEKTRAHLRKVKEQIEAYRKDARASYLEKFTKLEAQCKELSALIEQPITAIDGKIKEFEEAENVKKMDEIMCFFGAMKDRPAWLSLENVLNPKWKNKGMTVEKIKAEIKETVKQANADFDELKKLYGESPLWAAINQRFIECKNKSQTLIYAAQLERQHSEEQKRSEAIQKAREEQERAQAVQNAHTSDEAQGAVITPETAQNAGNSASVAPEPILRGKFEVECSKSALIALVAYMKENGIKYAVVKN